MFDSHERPWIFTSDWNTFSWNQIISTARGCMFDSPPARGRRFSPLLIWVHCRDQAKLPAVPVLKEECSIPARGRWLSPLIGPHSHKPNYHQCQRTDECLTRASGGGCSHLTPAHSREAKWSPLLQDECSIPVMGRGCSHLTPAHSREAKWSPLLQDECSIPVMGRGFSLLIGAHLNDWA